MSIHGSPVCKPKLKTQNSSDPTNKSPQISKKDNGTTDQGPKKRNKNELFYSKDELDSDGETTKKEEKNPKKRSKENHKKEGENKSPMRTNSSRPLEVSIMKKEAPKRKNKGDFQEKVERKKTKHEKPTKLFYKLLEGVTLVISGIPNPDRGNLRTMALAMGAKYKPDWDHSCTHLM